jgi:putative Holliday junction resolvase
MKILSVDFGDKRTGLALSDINGFLASPIGAITEISIKKVAFAVSEKAKELGVEKIIIGYPKNMNGTLGARAEKTEKFAALVKEQSSLEVILWDERCTTVSAHKILNETSTFGKKRKESVDTLSATIILQEYLDSVRIKNS